MREQEMRQRVFQFLKARMRNMLMPATLGIGLAVGACAQEGVQNQSRDSAAVADLAEDSKPVLLYGILFPDGSFPGRDSSDRAETAADLGNEGLPEASPDYGIRDASGLDLNKADAGEDAAPDAAPSPDQTVALDGAGLDWGKPADAGPDLGGIITKYIAPIPDAGRDAGVAPGPDAATDAGGIAPVYIAPLYIAQVPDAAAADGRPVVRYLAQMPDSSVVTPLYMAPLPS